MKPLALLVLRIDRDALGITKLLYLLLHQIRILKNRKLEMKVRFGPLSPWKSLIFSGISLRF